jgi:glycosyltransferase involved in cell wall biosynthesis
MRVVHLINCLSVGGAERQLVRLLAARSPGVDAVVVTLLDRDVLRGEVEACGVRVRSVGLAASRPTPAALLRLAAILREESPEVVQSWLYYANAAATLVRPLACRSPARRWPLAWNLRQTVESPEQEPRALRLALRLNAWLSPRPEAIVSNSTRSLADHRRLGFTPRREVVIPNGFDCLRAPHGAAARRAAREALGLTEAAFAVGCAGRDHPMKDHLGFVEAFATAAARDPRLVALLAGRGVDQHHAKLAAAIARHGLGLRVRLLGERTDLAALLPGLDCFVSSSAWGEAFPNVVAEAMSAGLAVIATEVGECREIVGDCGVLVAPRDSSALAAAIQRVAEMAPEERAALGKLARARIAEHFDIRAVAAAYESLWRELAAAASSE